MGDEGRELVSYYLGEIGVEPEFIIRESFLGYKWRKERGKLYGVDLDLPTKLIRIYYELSQDDITFDKLKKAFINKYINNESKLENVHTKEEVKGLKKMYEYVHSAEIEDDFDVYSLLDLHRALFSYAPFPEYAGVIRNHPVYLPGAGVELCDWRFIRRELNLIDEDVHYLRSIAPEIKALRDTTQMLAYLDCCVELNCRLIKVHPFRDGNGRTVRAFTNKLLEDVGLPPIYIREKEREEYHKAMNLAINEDDFTDIKNFYRYKVCDSIVELDINERVSCRNRAAQRVYIKKKSEDK